MIPFIGSSPLCVSATSSYWCHVSILVLLPCEFTMKTLLRVEQRWRGCLGRVEVREGGSDYPCLPVLLPSSLRSSVSGVGSLLSRICLRMRASVEAELGTSEIDLSL